MKDSEKKPKAFVSQETDESWQLGTGRRSFMRYRDPGITDATGGQVRIEGTRIDGGMTTETGWHAHTCEWHVMYVIKGSMKLELEDGVHILKSGSYLCLPPGTAHNSTYIEPGTEVIEMTGGPIGTIKAEIPELYASKR